jgi:hypothetical protein
VEGQNGIRSIGAVAKKEAMRINIKVLVSLKKVLMGIFSQLQMLLP